MKKLTMGMALMLAVLVLFTACTGSSSQVGNTGDAKEDYSNEEYVWINQANSWPMFVNNDVVGLKVIAEELGVKTKVIGPQDIDLNAHIAAIEQEIAKKPAGMMVVGWDATLTDPINKALDAGIPVVAVDGDIPESRRLAYIGTVWTNVGVEMAKILASHLTDKKGKVVSLGCVGAPGDQAALEGFIDTMKKLCPNITVSEKCYPSNGDPATAAATMKNLIQSEPDLVAAIGTDNMAGVGIAQAIKESGKKGQILGIGIDTEPENLKGVKEGLMLATLGQKRVLMTYYATKLLFDYNHSKAQITTKDKEIGITNIPSNVDTGLFVITPENVETFEKAYQERVNAGKQ